MLRVFPELRGYIIAGLWVFVGWVFGVVWVLFVRFDL